MANYDCVVRTNYFHVKSPDAFRDFMHRVYGAEAPVELWEGKDADGHIVFGFGAFSAVSGLKNAAEDEDELVDETAYDEFIAGLQQHIQGDDAVILLEAGSEKLCYIVGSAEVITASAHEHLDISTLAQQRAAAMLNNPDWTSKCEY